MSHQCRIVGKRFNTPQAVSKLEYLKLFKKDIALFKTSFYPKGNDPTKTCHLFFGNCMSGMVFETREKYFFNTGLVQQKPCNLKFIFLMLAHSYGKRLYSPECQP